MPTITLDKKDILKLVGKNIPDQQLKEKIPMLGTDLESIESNSITVEIFPNRTDMLTEEGFARALSSFLGIKTGLRSYKVNLSNDHFAVDPKVRKVRPAVAAAVIKNITMDNAAIKSMMDMQDKLTLTHGRNRKKVAIGIHDYDTITFPLVYTTKPRSFTFTPLDAKKPYTLNQIIELHPKGREFGHLLENFTEFPIWLDKKGQVLSMPPVINAEKTKVTSSTTSVFIDITGTDQLAVEQALNIIVANFADRGGKIYKVNEFPDMNPKKIAVKEKDINKMLGIVLTKQQIKKLLGRMGMALQGSTALYPSYRTDILHPIDIIEDIAIAYGYDKFTPEIPRVATIAEEDSFEKFKNKVAELLIGLDITEVSTYHLSNKDAQTTFMNSKADCIDIVNPKSAEYNVLRNQLLPSLIEIAKNNKHNEYPQKIGEIGAIFTKDNGGHHESAILAILVADTTANFTHIKQICDALCASLGMSCSTKEIDHPSYIQGRAAKIIIQGKDCGCLGELHPQVLQNFQLEMPAAALELDLNKICEEHLLSKAVAVNKSIHHA